MSIMKWSRNALGLLSIAILAACENGDVTGTNENLIGTPDSPSFAFGFPPPKCNACLGGVTQMTLKYNGTESAYITVMAGKDTIFDELVGSGDTFTLIGQKADGKLGAEVKVIVNGTETKIHTSCSKPIGEGSVFGDFEVVKAFSKDGGRICPPPPPGSCSACRGGVTQMTLKYNGTESAYIKVKAGRKVIFEGDVAPGGEFTLIGDKRDGKLGKEVKVTVNGTETKIHTSCSRPLGEGSVFGDFEVVEAFSKDGGRICPVGDAGLCDFGAPQVLIVTFTSDDCSASNHLQDPTKVTCTDFGTFPSTVRIVASDKENLADPKAKVWFDGQVSQNGTFSIDATNGGATKLKANTWVHIFDDASGNLLQLLNFHTSCSQPLALGDQFGSLTVTDFVNEF